MCRRFDRYLYTAGAMETVGVSLNNTMLPMINTVHSLDFEKLWKHKLWDLPHSPFSCQVWFGDYTDWPLQSWQSFTRHPYVTLPL